MAGLHSQKQQSLSGGRPKHAPHSLSRSGPSAQPLVAVASDREFERCLLCHASSGATARTIQVKTPAMGGGRPMNTPCRCEFQEYARVFLEKP